MAALNLATIIFSLNSNSFQLLKRRTDENGLSVLAAIPKQGVDTNPASCLEEGQETVDNDATIAKTQADKPERDMSVNASWKLWRPA
ncbi:hypothetical protein HI914_03497 [Erysiphe necator]|nr:hypothetical protein HI914_03497 [Erysiphe necator]